MPIEVELPDGSIAEFPDGMSDSDISSILSRQFPSQQSPSPAPQASPVVPAQDQTGVVPGAQAPFAPVQERPKQPLQGGLPRQEVETVVVPGNSGVNKDPRWLSPAQEAEYARLALDPSVSFESLNSWMQDRIRETGSPVPTLAIEGGPEGLAARREAWAKGAGMGGITYGKSPIEAALPENPTTVSEKDGFASQIARSFQAAGQEMGLGLLARKGADWLGWGMDTVDIMYPDATPEQKEVLQEELINSLQRKIREANEREISGDALAPWLIGQVLTPDPVDLVPGLKAARGATAAKRVAERAVEHGLLNTVADLGYQASEVSSGITDEFSGTRALGAGGLGAALGGGLAAGVEGVGAVRRAFGPPARVATGTSAAETGVPNSSVRPSKRDNSAQVAISDQINSITQDWNNSPTFEVHRNFGSIPGADKTALAFVAPNGTVRINTKAVNDLAKKTYWAPEDIVTALTYHESLGHYGLAQRFRQDLDTVLQDLFDNGTTQFRQKVIDWQADNPGSYGGSLIRATEEVLAQMSEKGPLSRSVFDKVADVIKNYAREAGLKLKFSEREIRSILAKAHSDVIEGVGVAAAPSGNRYMRPASEPRFIEADNENINELGFDNRFAQEPVPVSPDTTAAPGPRKGANQGYSELPTLSREMPQTIDNPDFPGRRLSRLPNPDEVFPDDVPRGRREVFERIDGSGKLDTQEVTTYTDAEARALIRERTGVDLDDGNRYAHDILPPVNDDTPMVRLEMPKMPAAGTKTAENMGEYYANAAAYFNQKALDYRSRGKEKSAKLAEQQRDSYIRSAQSRDPDRYGKPSTKESAEYYRGLADYHHNAMARRAARGDWGGVERHRLFRDDAVSKASLYAEASLENRYARNLGSDPTGLTRPPPKEVLDDVMKDYVPLHRTWDEAEAAAKERGLSPSDIRKLRTPEALDQRLFQYDHLAQRMKARINRLHDKIADGTFTMQDKAEYLRQIFQFNEVVGHIFDRQGETARALNALKAIETTRNRYGQLNEILSEVQGSGVSGFADDEAFLKFAKQLQAMMASNNPAGANKMIQSVTDPYWWQYLLTYRHAAMLSSLGTHAKNAYDNLGMIFRELEETALATMGGPVRQGIRGAGFAAQEGVSPSELVARLYGLVKAALDVDTYRRTASAFMEGNTQPGVSKVEVRDARIPGLSKVNDALYASDVFFRSFHENANLNALGVREARARGFTGTDALQEGLDIALMPSKEMLTEAQNMTNVALLVDKPFLQTLEKWKNIRPGMRGGEQFRAFAANIAFPFFRVTDRMLFQALRRSPLFFLDRVSMEDIKAGGARRDIAIARAAMGSALIYYYWQQAGEGAIEGAEADYKKQQSREGTGYRPNSVNTGSSFVDATAVNLSINPMGLQNNIAASIASLRKAYDQGAKAGDTAAGLGAAYHALMNVFSSMSYAENISGYLKPFIEEGASQETAEANLIAGLAGSMVPAGVRQINQQVFDTTKRVSTGDKSLSDRVTGRVKSAIPGLSTDLPAKVDVLGDEMQHGRSWFGMSNFQEIKQGELYDELRTLEAESEKALLSGAPSTIQHKKESIKLTAPQQMAWQRVQGRAFKDSMSEIIQDPRWKNAPSDRKVAIVKETMTKAYQVAKKQMLPELIKSTESVK